MRNPIVLVLLIILLIAALPSWPWYGGPYWNYGYYPSGGLGAVIIVLLILALLGVI